MSERRAKTYGSSYLFLKDNDSHEIHHVVVGGGVVVFVCVFFCFFCGGLGGRGFGGDFQKTIFFANNESCYRCPDRDAAPVLFPMFLVFCFFVSGGVHSDPHPLIGGGRGRTGLCQHPRWI